jgi:hypothetical protein
VQGKIPSAWLAGTVGTRPRRIVWIALVVVGLCLGIPALVRARLSASAAPGNAGADGRPTGPPDASAPAEINPAPPTACRPGVGLTSRLILATTILGKTRRAAVVNGRLYREGDTIVAGSEQYRLAGVAEDRIQLLALGAGAGQKRSVLLPSAADPKSDRDPCGSP